MSRHGLHTDKSETVRPFYAPTEAADQTPTSFFVDPGKSDNTPRALHLPSMPPHPHISRNEREVIKKREDIFAKAYSEGYQRGFEQGRSEGAEAGSLVAIQKTTEAAMASRKAELEAFVASLQKVLTSTDKAMIDWYRLAEEEIGPIVGEIASRVILEELKISRESVLSIVKEAMGEISHASTARIRVNPLDSALMRSYKDEIQACAQSVKGVEIVDDPTIMGGCLIETDGGLVDARIENKLAMLTTQLRKAA